MLNMQMRFLNIKTIHKVCVGALVLNLFNKMRIYIATFTSYNLESTILRTFRFSSMTIVKPILA